MVSIPVYVTDDIKISSVSYELNQSASFPSTLSDSVKFPNTIPKTLKAKDNFFIHMEVDAKFAETKEMPAQVYLKLTPKFEGHPLTSYGKF